jgi:hypothetical protein
MELPTPEDLRVLLRYEPDTGKLFWKPRDRVWFKNERTFAAWNTLYPGREAFTYIDNGYKQGTIFCKRYRAHRVAWAIFNGKWPQDEVDHINGIRCDNRIKNLRDVPKNINAKNTRRRSDNTSGYIGVSWNKYVGKWTASITILNKMKNLGLFESIEDAIAARQKAELGHGFTERHGADV